MSVEYCVRVSEEVDRELEQIDDEEIRSALVNTLERLAERENDIERQQDELHDRMGISKDGKDAEECSESELEREVQRFLRGERRTDPRLE